MQETTHQVYYSDARHLDTVPSNSIDLIVTSPPYPLIEMWDNLFIHQNPAIKNMLDNSDGPAAFELMHGELDKVWVELYRVLKDGGITCINIGDATRTLGDKFSLFPNHIRIAHRCLKIGFESLPFILWRKPTNAPTKFMGSGMLPAAAYVTLEHEYILIFRKNGKRVFSNPADKLNRRRSAFFWEERNRWFSDMWDFRGTRQNLDHEQLRDRSAAFPFELVYRLINMFSVRDDTVLDPFLGTGTTLFAAITSCRNSIGFEIDSMFRKVIQSDSLTAVHSLNSAIAARLNNHLLFAEEYRSKNREMKYKNRNYNFPVMTRQEIEILLNFVKGVESRDKDTFTATYYEEPHITPPGLKEPAIQYMFDL